MRYDVEHEKRIDFYKIEKEQEDLKSHHNVQSDK